MPVEAEGDWNHSPHPLCTTSPSGKAVRWEAIGTKTTSKGKTPPRQAERTEPVPRAGRAERARHETDL